MDDPLLIIQIDLNNRILILDNRLNPVLQKKSKKRSDKWGNRWGTIVLTMAILNLLISIQKILF